MKDKALKLALEALEEFNFPPHHRSHKAIAAIKEALAQPDQLDGLQLIHKADIDLTKKRATEAQPEQEPVAWMDIDEKGFGYGLRYWSEPDNRHEVALYTTPPQRTWVGLTDEEANELWESTDSDWELMKRTEAKLKEKNTK